MINPIMENVLADHLNAMGELIKSLRTEIITLSSQFKSKQSEYNRIMNRASAIVRFLEENVEEGRKYRIAFESIIQDLNQQSKPVIDVKVENERK